MKQDILKLTQNILFFVLQNKPNVFFLISMTKSGFFVSSYSYF